MQSLPPPLLPLGAWPQFVTWFAVPHPDKPGKLNKFPCDWRTGDVIDAHNSQHWTTAENALASASRWDRGHGCGAGFVFTEADPFFFLDGDKAWDGQAWSPIARELCERLPGAAFEVSLSHTGFHLIGRTAALEHRCVNKALGLELYTSGRFVALTGINATGDAATDLTAPLAAIAAQYFPPSETGEWEGWTTEPVPEWTGPEDDDDLVRRAIASGSKSAATAFGGRGNPTFADLWEARVDVLAAWKPGEGNKPFGQSEADQALANMLAFWTGKNCERMRTLMRKSALLREKWDSPSHRDYLENTITGACAFVQTVYTQPREGAPQPVAPIVSAADMLAASQERNRRVRDASLEYMGPVQQLDHFDQCFFVNDTGRIYSLAKNTEFTKAVFDVNYGGHLFVLDPSSIKTTDSAWDAYTKSRVNEPVIVDGLAFRPELGDGEIIRDGKRTYANSYVAHECVSREGDPTKFRVHMEKLLPDPEDRKILWSYLAAMAQNPGRKFQWWPVIQGAEGNGKTIIIAVMTYVMGQEYSHLVNAHAIAKDGLKFNKWIYRKTFVGVEEISLANKRDFLDEFKVVVTNERIPVEGKGADQINFDNRANGILCTNYKDGVPITVDTRRYGIFYTAQQSAEDIQRDGMTDEYFADLWDWLRGREAYADLGANYGLSVIAHELQTFALEPKYNPARLSTRAPKTTSTEAAVIASFGRAEQEILEAIEEGRVGFLGGWVSSCYLDTLLDQIRAPVPKNKRRAMMNSLGYDYHPTLVEGRTNSVVAPDNRKPRLYVRKGHLSRELSTIVEVERAYTKAQEVGAQNAAPSPAAIAFAPLRAVG